MKYQILSLCRRFRVLVAFIVMLFSFGENAATENKVSVVATTQQFAFHSDLATNLNDALIVAGVARGKGEPELFSSQTDECFAGLPPSARAGWNQAVDYYAKIVSPVDWNDRQQFLIRLGLAGAADKSQRARRFTRIARGFMTTATQAYEICHWTDQDNVNRVWIGHLMKRLEVHESAIATRLEVLYGTSWHGLPIRVDVVANALPHGANSIILSPAGGHILASNSVAKDDALEIIFHEASHTVAAGWRGDPLPETLAAAAKELELELPRDLWHVVLFYMTGETVRRILADHGEPNYTPYMNTHGLWKGPWGGYRNAIETVWPDYMDGKSTLTEASVELLKTLK